MNKNVLIPTYVLALGAALQLSAQVGPLADPIPNPIPQSDIKVKLTPVLTGLASPLELRNVDNRPDRTYILDQTGLILVLINGQLASTPLLNISGVLAQLNPAFPGATNGLNPSYDERGLLSMAFHPDFHKKNSYGYHKFYTLHNVPVTRVADFPMPAFPSGAVPNCQTVIAEWQTQDNADVVQASSYREVLRLDKPQFNHNGGSLHFGPDNLLYASLGDGGNANDVGDGHIPGTGNAQSLTTILGKVIRINPLHPAETADSAGSVSANGQYRIPNSNPFVGVSGALGEIYAYGLRNPYRFSFDLETGSLILADVGQNNIEEVNMIQRGGNYGWNVNEGSFLFDSATGNVFTDPSPDPALINPIVEYDHFEATVGSITRIAVIGGYLYRDTKIKDLRGLYVFGELLGNLFVADLEAGKMAELIPNVGMFIKGFGQDTQRQLYVLGSTAIGPSGTGGQVLRIDRVANNQNKNK